MIEKKRSIGIITLILSLFFLTSVFAETIILKSGQKIKAKIIERTDDYVIIDFYGTHVTYHSYEIERIDGESITTTANIKPSASQIEPSPLTFVSNEYGITIVEPEGWHMIPPQAPEKEVNSIPDATKEKYGKDLFDKVAKRIVKEVFKGRKRLINFRKYPPTKKNITKNPLIIIEIAGIDKPHIKTALDYAEDYVEGTKGYSAYTIDFRFLEGPKE